MGRLDSHIGWVLTGSASMTGLTVTISKAKEPDPFFKRFSAMDQNKITKDFDHKVSGHKDEVKQEQDNRKNFRIWVKEFDKNVPYKIADVKPQFYLPRKKAGRLYLVPANLDIKQDHTGSNGSPGMERWEELSNSISTGH